MNSRLCISEELNTKKEEEEEFNIFYIFLNKTGWFLHLAVPSTNANYFASYCFFHRQKSMLISSFVIK